MTNVVNTHNGVYGTVYAIKSFASDDLIAVGGNFINISSLNPTFSNIGFWVPSNRSWATLAFGGLNGPVYALCNKDNNTLIVGKRKKEIPL